LSSVVIDTNVLAVANRRAPQANAACVLACVERLLAIQREGRVSIDDGFRILYEYGGHASRSGQPGVGDAFFKWVHLNQGNPDRCDRVLIHPRGVDGNDFHEFPDDPALKSFDPSDRKFVAVAVASGHRPPVLNAVDSDWWVAREALSRHVAIEFICPDQFTPRPT